jgi:hypothetical protein
VGCGPEAILVVLVTAGASALGYSVPARGEDAAPGGETRRRTAATARARRMRADP